MNNEQRDCPLPAAKDIATVTNIVDKFYYTLTQDNYEFSLWLKNLKNFKTQTISIFKKIKSKHIKETNVYKLCECFYLLPKESDIKINCIKLSEITGLTSGIQLFYKDENGRQIDIVKEIDNFDKLLRKIYNFRNSMPRSILKYFSNDDSGLKELWDSLSPVSQIYLDHLIENKLKMKKLFISIKSVNIYDKFINKSSENMRHFNMKILEIILLEDGAIDKIHDFILLECSDIHKFILSKTKDLLFNILYPEYDEQSYEDESYGLCEEKYKYVLDFFKFIREEYLFEKPGFIFSSGVKQKSGKAEQAIMKNVDEILHKINLSIKTSLRNNSFDFSEVNNPFHCLSQEKAGLLMQRNEAFSGKYKEDIINKINENMLHLKYNVTTAETIFYYFKDSSKILRLVSVLLDSSEFENVYKFLKFEKIM